MVSVYDVNPNELIDKAAIELEKVPELEAPDWAKFVKTGTHKEKPPINKKWWYTRVAAVLRTVYMRGPLGVQALRSKYGGKKNRGVRPEKTFKGSGSIARKALQQLEKAGLIIQAVKGVHKGRVLTPKGKSILDKISVSIIKENKKAVPKVEAPVEQKPVEQKVEAPKVETKGLGKPVGQKVGAPVGQKVVEEKPTPVKPTEKIPTAQELADKNDKK